MLLLLLGPACGQSGSRTAQSAVSGAGSSAPASEARTLDGFEQLAWQASASDGVLATVSSVPGVSGQAMRLTFDLSGTSGYAVARRALPLDLSGDFELSFSLRGAGPANNFELKLVDASGENVWWYHRRDFQTPVEWSALTIKRRQVDFAWGPTADKTLREIAFVELVISSGAGGGQGFVEIDELRLRPRQTPGGPAPRPRVASSVPAGDGAARALDGDPATPWQTGALADGRAELVVDLGRERDLGGVLASFGDARPWEYGVEASLDGAQWRPVGEAKIDPRLGRGARGQGALVPVRLTDVSARYLRIRMKSDAAAPQGFSFGELEVLDADEVESATELIQALARRLPRGSFPRGYSGEQPYWTIVGVDGGAASGLLGEDGALELFPGGPSVEPFVLVGGERFSWANAKISQALDGGYLPIPEVTWQQGSWDLTITALAAGDADGAELASRYVVRNLGQVPLVAQLVLAVRPLQVNPPAQFLNISGGVSPIPNLAWDSVESALFFGAKPALRLLSPPDRAELYVSSSLGPPMILPAAAPAGRSPGRATIHQTMRDSQGLLSAALVYELRLPPGGSAEVVLAAPLIESDERSPRRPVAPVSPLSPLSEQLRGDPGAGGKWFAAALAAMRKSWHEKLDRVELTVPAAGAPIVETLRSSLAYMLLSRDGAMLRPGTRSYARAWIRDGAMISEALLRLGHPAVAAEFLRYYAPYQFASGKVPCCVDAHGAGPVPENDSHGQLMYLARLVYRYGKDRALAQAVWPNVLAAARYQEEQRQTERTAKNQTPARKQLWGLMPPSISHEGYSARPAYSYWDDFWALRGIEDAAALAQELGDAASATRLGGQRDELTRELRASLEATAAAFGIDFIAGAADLGDFDATSTTIAVAPGVSPAALPEELLVATFERYWKEHVARRDGAKPWNDYTPYELRVPGTFVRLGQRQRAEEALAFFFADRRPAAWNQWAEVVGREARKPRFIGDMPHAWVHSDYARSALDLFAYERPEDQAMVLGAGIPMTWLADGGVSIGKLPTPWGPLGYSLKMAPEGLVLELSAAAVPPGGFVLPWPFPLAQARPGLVRVVGRAKGAGRGAAKLPAWRPARGLMALAAGAASAAGVDGARNPPAEAPLELVITERSIKVVVALQPARR